MLPRGFGMSTAYPASASRTAFGSETEKYAFQHQVGPPWTSTSSGSGPSAPAGVMRSPSISRPSGAVQESARTSGKIGVAREVVVEAG